MSILGVLGIGSAIGSGIAQLFGAKKDRDFQQNQAQNQMDFQKEMSDTSYQRSVVDMQKAGLNPALAYNNGGASSANGAMASGDGGYEKAFNSMFQLANTAILANSQMATQKDIASQNNSTKEWVSRQYRRK